MIFSELYSAYYNAVAGILTQILQGERSEKAFRETVKRYAFSESVLTILPALKNEKWQLLKEDRTTPIQNPPSMPLTLLQKRWWKAISLDPRVRLFDLSFQGLEGVAPLFTPEDYLVYDCYADGDPYSDAGYIRRFRQILGAIRERQPLKIEMVNRRGDPVSMNLLPRRLEYSEKDDKFRLISAGCRFGRVVNLARILHCEPYDGAEFESSGKTAAPRLRTVTLRLLDERNALERCLLHFSHFEKRVERLDEKRYLLHIRYEKGDETEMVIRVLGFGPMIEVTAPSSFRHLIVERLQMQKHCGLF